MIKVTLATKGILAYPGSQEALPSNDGTREREEERGRKKANLTPFLSHAGFLCKFFCPIIICIVIANNTVE